MDISSDSVVRTVPDKAVAPYYSFPDQNEFIWRHEQATLIEMHNEEQAVKRLNEKRRPFKAWPVAPIPGLTTPFMKSWLFLVKTPCGGGKDDFPSLTDRFTIDMESKIDRPEGIFSLVHLPASRIQNPYETLKCAGGAEVSKCAAFKVDVPRSWQSDNGVHVELDLMANFQTATSINEADNITVNHEKHQVIVIQWEISSLTFEAELAALHCLTDNHRLEEMAPARRSLNAFRMIQDFRNPSWISYRNLHDEFPQLQNPARFWRRVPRLLVDKVRAFNADHRAALDGLKCIPNCLYFINGCPGAGKTEWNMVLAALIQSKRSPNSRRRRSPILFLVDINKTVDDAANRYYTLCKEAGLKLRIIRMHGWPYEMRHSSTLNKGSSQDQAASEAELDFTKRFLTTVSLACHTKAHRDPNVAPTLDEAAWEYYELHKDDCFPALRKLLARMENGEVFNGEDWKSLRSQVSVLYRAVLAQADFVATTPVAAYGKFSKLFEPDLVFVDEAPHARELTTLIAIAFFSPLAWILTGDVHQTRPFVKSGDKRQVDREGLKFNPFAEQLRVSTMARAAAAGATNARLLVNKRSYANLHRLPSKMFYNGEMVSGYSGESLYPPSVLHAKRYLERLGPAADISENRLVVRLKDSCEHMHRNSFWNPAHHKWILEQVQQLLHDEAFAAVDGRARGTIMIATPYSTAVREYHSSVKKWPQELQDRVEVLTIDKAQGNQADVVFLDMVRTAKAGFMDDPYRLNVAITRARQAEIIVMHHRMTWKQMLGGIRIRAQYLSQIWDDAVAQRRMVSL
ncbi:AAA domain-containing protein [Hirsutella rhossiliensis]|uniref:AAA domain-containing protein n=1 Tax=Hirsutella rhossiliensis TaxID=111463 RepID=A0A9P8N1P7_9HYPO|nr:AAA domain-containing protein [Hirsutella rhossiliensis]KAH0964316.1 AAA domain-containing protein [Hirsutella rhossiliensis]